MSLVNDGTSMSRDDSAGHDSRLSPTSAPSTAGWNVGRSRAIPPSYEALGRQYGSRG